jgi:glycopeptide antibiotics resistance protein
MIELHLDLKFHMKPWKKALFFSLLFNLIILIIFIIIITFMLQGFKFGLVAAISVVYIGALLLCFQYMYRRFDEKFKILSVDTSKK